MRPRRSFAQAVASARPDEFLRSLTQLSARLRGTDALDVQLDLTADPPTATCSDTGVPRVMPLLRDVPVERLLGAAVVLWRGPGERLLRGTVERCTTDGDAVTLQLKEGIAYRVPLSLQCRIHVTPPRSLLERLRGTPRHPGQDDPAPARRQDSGALPV